MMQSPQLRAPTRSLEQYLDELLGRLKALPLTDRGRVDLIRRIWVIEDEIAARQSL